MGQRRSSLDPRRLPKLTKLLQNIFRSLNIALVNELALLSDRTGTDIREVVDAASTKPFRFMRFEPGPGMGGHCLPVDPFYLTWRAREFELAGKVNHQIPRFCLEKIECALNDVCASRFADRRSRSSASKPASGIPANPPALRVMQLLRERTADLSYHDPHVAELPAFGLASEGLATCSLAATSP